jgi:tRNA-dihydrouridine synthase 3
VPFRRICKKFGADITVSEMGAFHSLTPQHSLDLPLTPLFPPPASVWSKNLLTGAVADMSLLKRHSSEDVFGIQLAGSSVEQMAAAVEFLNHPDA